MKTGLEWVAPENRTHPLFVGKQAGSGPIPESASGGSGCEARPERNGTGKRAHPFSWSASSLERFQNCTISALFLHRFLFCDWCSFRGKSMGDRGDGRSEIVTQKRVRNSAETGVVEHDERTRRHTDRSCGATRPIVIEAFADITLIGHGIMEWFRPNTGPTVVAANTGSERSIYSTAFWEGISAGHRCPAT